MRTRGGRGSKNPKILRTSFMYGPLLAFSNALGRWGKARKGGSTVLCFARHSCPYFPPGNTCCFVGLRTTTHSARRSLWTPKNHGSNQPKQPPGGAQKANLSKSGGGGSPGPIGQQGALPSQSARISHQGAFPGQLSKSATSKQTIEFFPLVYSP